MKVLAERLAAEVDDGPISVRKYVFDLGLTHVAGFRLTLHNRADIPVQVRLVEDFPTGFSLARVKVHPEYAPENWSKSDREPRMVYEDTVPPGEAIDTVYGMRVEDAVDPYLGDPRVTHSGPSHPGDTEDDRDRPASGPDRPPVPTTASGDGFAFGEDRTERD